MEKKLTWHELFTSRPLYVAFFLGFASILPAGLTSTPLQAWYTAEGLSITTIGMLGLIGIPYTLKFLWSPLFDYYSWPFLGRRRGWLIVTQIILLFLLLAMAFLNPRDTPYLLALVALGVAFFSASQDIAIDALRTETLSTKERGMGNALYVTAARLGAILTGGLSLVFAEHIGFQLTYLILASLMGVGIITTLLSPEPEKSKQVAPNLKDAIIYPLKDFFSRRNSVILLLLIVFYKCGDAFIAQLTTAFLMRGANFSLQEIGVVLKSVGMFATIIGAITGGFYLARWNIYSCLMIFGILQAVSNMFYWLLAMIGHNYTAFVTVIFADQFCGGLGTAAFMAFLMSLCNHRFTASQYALLSAVALIPRSFLGVPAGMIVDAYGWIPFFTVGFVLSLPALAILWWIGPSVKSGSLAPA
jgi:PAT family beta-lactamase induction signal transducer AmpG